ncbi:MAG: hypothetical protein L0312_16940, partial [Acidobacteria bacterium]|nr:hypothetical protein [Acidobacteriota bacterium]
SSSSIGSVERNMTMVSGAATRRSIMYKRLTTKNKVRSVSISHTHARVTRQFDCQRSLSAQRGKQRLGA